MVGKAREGLGDNSSHIDEGNNLEKGNIHIRTRIQDNPIYNFFTSEFDHNYIMKESDMKKISSFSHESIKELEEYISDLNNGELEIFETKFLDPVTYYMDTPGITFHPRNTGLYIQKIVGALVTRKILIALDDPILDDIEDNTIETIAEHEVTERGFSIYNFTDYNGGDCSLQKSSIATDDLIWLGTGERRMHLTQDKVRKMLPILQKFVETGEIY